jgi:hypothetical protein
MRTAGLRPVGALGVAVILAVALACAHGTVQTVNGPRPAAEVQIQDAIGDILQSLDAGYTAAVAAHDGRVATEDPVVHAAHRATLIKQHDGLTAAWSGLLAWKAIAGSTYTATTVLQPLLGSLPSFLQLAVDLKAMTQAQADVVNAFVNANVKASP